MASVQEWSGLEARALRFALRMTLREFAARLGVGERTVSKWEALGMAIVPRQVMQAALDTKLREADEEVHIRFRQFLANSPGTSARFSPSQVETIDYELWADDLDRSLVFLSRQELGKAKLCIDRWMTRFTPNSSNTRGMHLYGRSLRLLGDIKADQGVLSGPDSAQDDYLRALEVFKALRLPRRISQVELQLTVLDEMAGRLEAAASRYRMLATDERLDQRDRTRAQLWIGTALSKLTRNEAAVRHILPAIRAFEALDEADDWSVAHQKLALGLPWRRRLERCVAVDRCGALESARRCSNGTNSSFHRARAYSSVRPCHKQCGVRHARRNRAPVGTVWPSAPVAEHRGHPR